MKEFQFPQIFKAVIGKYFPYNENESKPALAPPSPSVARYSKNACLTCIGIKNQKKDLDENSEVHMNHKIRQIRKQNRLQTTGNSNTFNIGKIIEKRRNRILKINQEINANNNSLELSVDNGSYGSLFSRKAAKMMSRVSILQNLAQNDRKSSFVQIKEQNNRIQNKKLGQDNNGKQKISQIRISTRQNIKKGSRMVNNSKNHFRLEIQNKPRIRISKRYQTEFIQLTKKQKQSSQQKEQRTNCNIKQSDFLLKSKKDQSNFATPAYSKHIKTNKKTKVIGAKPTHQQKYGVTIKPQKKKKYKNRLIRNKSVKIVHYPPIQQIYLSERQILSSYYSSQLSIDYEEDQNNSKQSIIQNKGQNNSKEIHRISDELKQQYHNNWKFNNFLQKSRKFIDATKHNLYSTKKLNKEFFSINNPNKKQDNTKYANVYIQLNDFLLNRNSTSSENMITKKMNSQTVIFYERQYQDQFAAQRRFATQRENLIIDYGLKFMYKMNILKQNKL